MDYKSVVTFVSSSLMMHMFLTGMKGEMGDMGQKGRQGNMFGVVTVHSQSDQVPQCPPDSMLLWNGYSLVFTDGNGYGHGQDLGKPGSCVRRFNALPFLMCQGRGEHGLCSYAFRNEYTYWLATMNDTFHGNVPSNETEEFVSRCAVCRIDASVLAVHSQSADVPDCPQNWTSLWEGYSYLMVKSL